MGAGRDALNGAVARAWQVLDLPVPATTGVCVNCCLDPQIEADFLNHSARDLPAAYVRDWYFAAYSPDLRFAQMGWLLPRVMQMLAEGEEVTNLGLEVVLARLPLAGFPDAWPRDAVQAVRDFAHAYLVTACAEEGTEPLDEVLCMIGESGLPIGDFLADLDRLADDTLADMLHRSWVVDWGGKIPLSPFWSTDTSRAAVWGWYTSPELYKRMMRAAENGNAQASAVAGAIARVWDQP